MTKEPLGPANRLDETRVAILLSTFNGEQYLAEQLASLVTQTHRNWLVYWRDDGSSDRTMQIMAEFAAGPGQGRLIPGPDAGRLRPTGSFLTLLRSALSGPAACFAFADQDDIWLPDKLANGVAALSKVPPARPALFFCGRTLVSATLGPVGQVLAPRHPPAFPAALTQNLTPGCCMMLNRAAAELIGASDAPDGTWHDWWAYVVVAAHAGLIIPGETADILYRQHADNVVGEPRDLLHRMFGAARRGPAPFMKVFWRQIAALRAAPTPMPDATRTVLATIESGNRGGFWARLRALRVPGLVRQTWPETLLFRLWFLLDRA